MQIEGQETLLLSSDGTVPFVGFLGLMVDGFAIEAGFYGSAAFS